MSSWIGERITGSVSDHGGALDRAIRRFGAGPDWLDLSTGINPWCYPVSPLPPEAWQRLPDDGALAALKQAACFAYGAPTGAPVAAAPGSQALIQWLPRLTSPTRVAILAPTYAEHARCWRLAGHEVAEVADLTDAAPVLVLTHPNNPDGRRFDPGALLRLADQFAGRGGFLVVDEAFADSLPATSLVPEAGRPGLVVLRSFGKFFGLAGLRLGFAFGPADLVERLEAALGPWAVSGPALAIGRDALSDTAWIATTRARLTEAAEALGALLAAHDLEPLGGTEFFRLVRTDRAAAIHDRLGRHHILVRDFAAYPDRLRFGLPPDQAAMERLNLALSA